MMRWAVLSVLVLFVGTLSAESLWDSQSAGFYTGRVRLKEGDLLRVQLDGEASLSFMSTKVSEKSLSLEFNAVKDPPPTSSVPGGKTSDNLKIQGKSELKAKNTYLVVKVSKVEDNALVRLTGQRTLKIGGGTDTITLTGLCDTRFIKGRDVSWKDLGELTLAFVTSSESASTTLKKEDFTPDGKALTPEKQKELLLRYYNRFLDGLFPASE